VLRRIFGSKQDEVTGEWRRLHNKELYALNTSPTIIRVIEKKTTEIDRICSTYGWRREVHTGLYWENLKGGDHLEDLREDGRIILKWIFERLDGGGGA
jgi:hypothetical protein